MALEDEPTTPNRLIDASQAARNLSITVGLRSTHEARCGDPSGWTVKGDEERVN